MQTFSLHIIIIMFPSLAICDIQGILYRGFIPDSLDASISILVNSKLIVKSNRSCRWSVTGARDNIQRRPTSAHLGRLTCRPPMRGASNEQRELWGARTGPRHGSPSTDPTPCYRVLPANTEPKCGMSTVCVTQKTVSTHCGTR